MQSRWQKEFDALPGWAQQMVRALSGCASYGGGDDRRLKAGMAPNRKELFTGFHVLLRDEAYLEWMRGFGEMRELAAALTAPWPPPPPPVREKRAFNIVELMTDGEEDGGFDQPCAFGNRVSGHAVYCHNEAWPDAPRKCRYGKGCAEVYGIPEEENRHEDCPGFVANPDYTELPITP